MTVAIDMLRAARNDAANTPRRGAVSLSTESVLFVLFVGALAWVPFWFGSDRPIAWAINAVVFPGLAALYEISVVVRGVPHLVGFRRVRLSAILFAATVVWILVQNATWSPVAWQHPIWELASELFNRPVPGSISIDRDLTALALLRLMTAASTFWLALQLSRDAAFARGLMWSVVGIGAVYALVGILALTLMPGGRVFSEGNSAKFLSSTFVNQNHYATFAGIGLIAATALTLRIYRREFARSGRLLRVKIATVIGTTGSKAAFPLALTLVILAALLFTGSRGGIISTVFGLFILLMLNLSGAGRSIRNEALLLTIATLALGAAFIGFGDVFAGSIAERGLYDEGRLRVLILTLRSILTSPLLGFGYGTFASLFPLIRDHSLSIVGVWDRAHNTYLEIFQGLGLVFGGALMACVLALVWNCLKGARTRTRHATIPAIAASTSFLIGANALVDFSLQLQAVTLTFMAVLGAGVAQSWDVGQSGNGDSGVASSASAVPWAEDQSG